MAKNVLETIREAFSNPEKFTPEAMETLVHDTLSFFNALRVQLESKDDREKAEAIQLAALLKAELEAQALRLCKTAGMDPQALEAFIKNPSHFSSEEWQAMEQAKGALDEYNQDLKATGSSKQN
jgi:ATP-dependent Clp protease ATP-binding subunit ClpA